MSSCPPATWLVVAASLAWPLDAGAATLCGRVQSGGRPVRGASVVATAEGVVARSDSTGLFCLTELDGEVQRLRIVALGFSPVERYLPARPETLVIELVPLRALTATAKTVVAPAPKTAPKLALQPIDLSSEFPEYLTSADSTLFAQGARDPATEIPRSLHALLSTPSLADSVTLRGSWLEVARGAARAYDVSCGEPGLEVSLCDYLERAEAVAMARAAEVTRDPTVIREARSLLDSYRDGTRDPAAAAWAARLEGLLPH